MKNQTLGKRILLLRKSLGYTQMELAERKGVSDKAISRWERDETSPDISALINLADEFGVTIDDLIKGNVNVSNSEEIANEETIEKTTSNYNIYAVAKPVPDATENILKNKLCKYKKITFILYLILAVAFGITTLLWKILTGTVIYLILLIIEIVALMATKIAGDKDIDTHLISDYYTDIFSVGKDFFVVVCTLHAFQVGAFFSLFKEIVFVFPTIFKLNSAFYTYGFLFAAVGFVVSSVVLHIAYVFFIKVKKLQVSSHTRAVDKTKVAFFAAFVIFSVVIFAMFKVESRSPVNSYRGGDRFYSMEAFEEAKQEKEYNDRYQKIFSEKGDVLWENGIYPLSYDNLNEQFEKISSVYALTSEQLKQIEINVQELEDKYTVLFEITTVVTLVVYMISMAVVKKKQKIMP